MEFLSLERLGAPVWLWLTFASLLVSLLAFDLGVLNRRDHEIGVTESLLLSAVYIGLGLAFGGVVWGRLGADAGLAYLTGYIVEKTLSLDNVFVIAMIFLSLSVPRVYRHRVLFWGILVAIALRGLMIGFGAALIANFAWTLYVFSAVLIVTGVRTLFWPSERTDVVDNAFVRFLRSRLNVTDRPHGNRFILRLPHPTTQKPTWFVTPLFLALVSIEIADVVFAVDSVPAIFAITTDPFVVYTSNIFAILGLRALFFALSAVMARVRYLEQTLAVVLIFIGSKIFVADLIGEEIPPWLSLAGSVGIIAAGGLYSLWRTQPTARRRWAPRAAAAGVAAVSIVGIGWAVWPSRQEATARYETQAVDRGSVIRAVSATGAVERAPPIHIDASVAGRVLALYCGPGDSVKAGQVCAKIDPGPYLRRVARETEALAAARARLEKSEARAKARKKGAREPMGARATRDKSEVDRRQAALSAAEAMLARTRIVMPVDGLVLSRNAEVGRPAEGPDAAPLFVLAPDMATMTIDAGSDEIELGDKASFAVDSLPDHLFAGEVVKIHRGSPAASRKREIRIDALDPNRLLADGMRTKAVVVVDRRDDVLRVPNRAIDYSSGKAREHRLEPPPPGWSRLWRLRNGTAETVTVRLGLDDGLYSEVVESDLQPGDRLIVGGVGERSARATEALRGG